MKILTLTTTVMAFALLGCGDSGTATSTASGSSPTSDAETSDASSSAGSSDGSSSDGSSSDGSSSDGTSSTSDPTTTTTGQTSEGTTEPTTDPSTTEPTTDSETTDPSTTDPSTTDPSTTDPSTTDPDTMTSGDPSTSMSDTGGMCVELGESCAMGELCCEGMCCAGPPVPPGQEFCGMPCPISDKNAKRGFRYVDTDKILEGVAGLEITTWSYKDDKGRVRHLGPMAQDFQATFGVGDSGRYIFQVDADGVSLAAIQALNRRVHELEGENRALRTTLKEFEARLRALESD